MDFNVQPQKIHIYNENLELTISSNKAPQNIFFSTELRRVFWVKAPISYVTANYLRSVY